MSQFTASEGDCLCNIAVDHGFLNCQPLRDEPANSGLLNRELKDGDIVTIPDIRPRIENGATDQVHKFVLKTAPPVSIRYVHGSPDKHYLEDDTISLLNVSNFVTNLAGKNGQQPFPAEFEFHEAGHVDPDTFKVEVVDPQAGGSVKVLLEAMKPIYARDPATGNITVTGHQQFKGKDFTDRSVKLTCAKVHSGVAYRSKYLRLVVDERDGDKHPGDKQKVKEQTLLVTDSADGLGTGAPADNDTLEILDQEVRASYTIERCPAPDPNKCTVRTTAPIGGGERRRLRVAFHIFRTSRGGTAVGGQPDAVTLQGARLRTFKWLRRVYAQANISPKLSSYTAEIVDPPPPNMIVISPDTGSPADGISMFPVGKFGNTDSLISFTLTPLITPPAFADVDINLNLNLVALPREPIDVANALIAALPAGFKGAAFENPPAFNASALGTTKGSCDVIITRVDGTLVSITKEFTDERNIDFSVFVPRIVGTIHPKAVALGLVLRVAEDAPVAVVLSSTADQRRIIRFVPGTDDVLDFYVVDFLEDKAGNPKARGSAVMRGREVRAGFEGRVPVRNCVFIGRSPDEKSDAASTAHAALELSDFNFHTIPHETGHILGDFFHPPAGQDFHNRTELMGVGKGTRNFNAVDHCKRIPDLPVLVKYFAFDPVQTNPGDFTPREFNVVDRMRTEGAGLLEPW